PGRARGPAGGPGRRPRRTFPGTRREGERVRARLAERREPAPPVLSHPDSHGRSRNLAGSTPEWLSEGRGLSPPVGACTPPRRRALRRQYRRVDLGAPRLTCRGHRSGGGATVDRVGGAGLALGELLHLRGHGDGLTVVGEPPRRRGGDATRHADQWQPLEHGLAVFGLDEPPFKVLGTIELVDLGVEPLHDSLRRLLRHVW